MKSKSCCNRWPLRRQIDWRQLLFPLLAGIVLLTAGPRASAASAEAPPWMHALVNAPLPAHDEKDDAVLLYSDTQVTVLTVDKIRTQVRRVYKILRPGGREYGGVFVDFHSPGQKIVSLHGWCIPASGKDYEVKDKDAMEVSLPKIEGSELITDVRAKVLHIPAPDPGNIIGYEYVREEQPLLLQEEWDFQQESPARESHYSLELPAGWEYKAAWLNYAEVKPTQNGSQWQWTVNDVKGIREEEDMPPYDGVAGQMIVSFFPPGGAGQKGFSNWQEMGTWYRYLEAGRFDASPEIKQQVAALTASEVTPLAKMRAIAQFVQHDIRYVAIELGIGGWQPHPAADVFAHKYGDCKDKATLMHSMLHEIGIDSYQVIINTDRGAVTPATPAHRGFNHEILAIKLPDEVHDASLVATVQDPRLGRLLYFDPTNEVTPFGEIRGHLQANWGLLVTPQGGQLVELPEEPVAMNGITRTGTLTLDPSGTLSGEVNETRMGDRAWSQRWALRTLTNDRDRIKPIESLLASSLGEFRITRATLLNPTRTDQPFGFDYTFVAQDYAKSAGDLLLVRPRVIGTKANGILETKDPRLFPIEFDGPVRDTDSFDIILPPGYQVDDLPAPVDADYGFASYHSKSEVKGNVIHYTRDFEVKQLSVPVSKAADLKQFYRIIATDERNTAVLKPAAH